MITLAIASSDLSGTIGRVASYHSPAHDSARDASGCLRRRQQKQQWGLQDGGVDRSKTVIFNRGLPLSRGPLWIRYIVSWHASDEWQVKKTPPLQITLHQIQASWCVHVIRLINIVIISVNSTSSGSYEARSSINFKKALPFDCQSQHYITVNK